ncbi:MAG: UDP-2,3-diacylglucosamine diphosphatase [Bacteroidales bacterium]|nr:UDP-2,3-diacylglucosamine diphosphatase [Bacteroidales bacterium]MCB8998614.1 UDP-2,3-diacylglucosamine diphosphatase [Bacteroidales bacterium]MCB9012518.1 UDP-2,3-diacylglucosamine diphosphatase [Bacteroidales bacterium]
MQLPEHQKIYFVSDAHLGHPPREKSLEREKLLIRWLDEVRRDAHSIYLLGDIFDYWFEYRKVVPRGFTRLLGKIAEITDSGIPVYFFTGNHDVWVFDYLPEEVGIEVCRHPLKIEINQKRFFIAHGDGLGPYDRGYKIIKSFFTNRVLQWLYARIHPNASIAFAHRWSKHSRLSKDASLPFLGEDKEHQVLFSKSVLENEHFDFFIYGHRHLPLDLKIAEHSRLICLGDWFINFTYAVFDGKNMELKSFLPSGKQ